jgi:hypothetical protein
MDLLDFPEFMLERITQPPDSVFRQKDIKPAIANWIAGTVREHLIKTVPEPEFIKSVNRSISQAERNMFGHVLGLFEKEGVIMDRESIRSALAKSRTQVYELIGKLNDLGILERQGKDYMRGHCWALGEKAYNEGSDQEQAPEPKAQAEPGPEGAKT